MDDLEFERRFEAETLPPALFDHRGHLRLAWIYLDRYGESRAIEKACRDIRAFARSHGDGGKFHMTVTVASIKVVHHYVQKSPDMRFLELLDQYPELGSSFKELLARHYSAKRLASTKARLEYLPPDRLPFGPGPLPP